MIKTKRMKIVKLLLIVTLLIAQSIQMSLPPHSLGEHLFDPTLSTERFT